MAVLVGNEDSFPGAARDRADVPADRPPWAGRSAACGVVHTRDEKRAGTPSRQGRVRTGRSPTDRPPGCGTRSVPLSQGVPVTGSRQG